MLSGKALAAGFALVALRTAPPTDPSFMALNVERQGASRRFCIVGITHRSADRSQFHGLSAESPAFEPGKANLKSQFSRTLHAKPAASALPLNDAKKKRER